MRSASRSNGTWTRKKGVRRKATRPSCRLHRPGSGACPSRGGCPRINPNSSNDLRISPPGTKCGIPRKTKNRSAAARRKSLSTFTCFSDRLLEVANQTSTFPSAEIEAVIVHSERKEPIEGTSPVVADLGDERPVIFRQRDALLILKRLDDGDGQRGIDLVLVGASTEDLSPRVSSVELIEKTEDRRLVEGLWHLFPRYSRRMRAESRTCACRTKDSDGLPESRYVAPSRYSLRTTALLCDSSLAA